MSKTIADDLAAIAGRISLETDRLTIIRAVNALRNSRERMWCTACGTVTRDWTCHCNEHGQDHELSREPNFVNYADAMQEAAHEQAKEVEQLRSMIRASNPQHESTHDCKERWRID